MDIPACGQQDCRQYIIEWKLGSLALRGSLKFFKGGRMESKRENKYIGGLVKRMMSAQRSLGRWKKASPVLSVCLSVSLYLSLSLRLSLSLCLCLSVCLSACLSVCLSVCLPGCLSVRLSVCLSVCLSFEASAEERGSLAFNK